MSLLIIAFLAGLFFYRRRHRQRESAEAEAEAAEAEPKNRPPEWMYASGPASPGPGPVSSSTGMETAETVRTTQTTATQPSTAPASTVPDSLVSPATPGTVESGGDAVYEMHGMSMTFFIQAQIGNRYCGVLSLTSTQIHHPLNFPRHSIPPTSPTTRPSNPNLNVGPTPIRDEAPSLLSHHRLPVRRVRSTPIQQAITGARLRCRWRRHCRLIT